LLLISCLYPIVANEHYPHIFGSTLVVLISRYLKLFNASWTRYLWGFLVVETPTLIHIVGAIGVLVWVSHSMLTTWWDLSYVSNSNISVRLG
jgi:hypothetical protein